ncbi:ATP-binding protein [Alteromonas oceani]|uniref:histidine kinase n=1 Tax=Alteromonas oceani TaxID=2071609 RepID=A0ABV7K2C0_9ALTE|nr:ATP-binding protein [Alteromonas oceani]
MSLTKAISALFSYHANEPDGISEQMLKVLANYFSVDCLILGRDDGKLLTLLASVGEEGFGDDESVQELITTLPLPLVELFVSQTQFKNKTINYLCSPISAACGFHGALYFLNRNLLPDEMLTKNIQHQIEVVTQLLATQVALSETKRVSQKKSDSMRSMERLATIGWWEVDLVENTIYWSPQTRAIHEVPADFEPDLNTAIEFYKDGEDREKISNGVFNGIYHGESWDLEVRILTYHGDEKWVAALGTAEMVNGQCVRLFGAFQDIDERKRAKLDVEKQRNELELLLNSRNRLLSRISHELRTPVNAVNGMLHTIDAGVPEGSAKEKLSIAKANARTLIRLINDITDFNQVNHEEFRLYSTKFLVSSLLSGVMLHYQQPFNEKGIRLSHSFNISEDSVKGDEVRLRQILTNLLDNALKFTHSGKVSLRVTTHRNDSVVILQGSVIDTGIGISEKDIPELFLPFSQTNSFNNLITPGRGLGLSIVKQLCEKMNGHCAVKSEFGKGSEFFFEVSLKAVEPSEQPAEPEQKSFSEINARFNVLLVDDVDTNRLVAEVFLNELGLKSDHAVNGEEALSALKRSHYDIIFMDCHMPVMDGFEATQKIRETNNDNVIIIAMTADVTQDNQARCEEAGMDKVILKPLTIEKIIDVIEFCTGLSAVNQKE